MYGVFTSSLLLFVTNSQFKFAVWSKFYLYQG